MTESATFALRIDALLPQTQCTRCGYPACLDYAHAVARGDADINQCPPGGQAGVDAMAALLGRASKALNPANGIEKPREIALIDEKACIGCTKCIQACPVDAILGASKMMHTILVDECTGCELCIAPCPVDCIAMIEVGASRVPARQTGRPAAATGAAAPDEPAPARAARYRARYVARNARLAREADEHATALAARKRDIDARDVAAASARGAVAAAIARSKAKKAGGRA